MTLPKGHKGTVTWSAKISRWCSTACTCPAASLNVTGLPDFFSGNADVGSIACEAPLSAMATGFMSFGRDQNTSRHAKNLLATNVRINLEVSLAYPWICHSTWFQGLTILDILNHRVQTLLLSNGCHISLAGWMHLEAMPDVFLPCWCKRHLLA